MSDNDNNNDNHPLALEFDEQQGENENNDNPNQIEPPPGYEFKKHKQGMLLPYDDQFPDEQLPEEVHERKERSRVPIGFNYDKDPSAKIEDYTLKNLVSSKMARDIVRSGNFMPGQFDIWNRKKSGGNGKYSGISEDLDNDGIDEFVVRRGDKIVAVNGYTTKASDFPFKARYYSYAPTAEARRETPYRKYLDDVYYGPVYNDDGSKIVKWKGNDASDSKFKTKYRKHSTHAPSALSPYRAVSQYIVAPAIKVAIYEFANGIKEKAKIVRKALMQKYTGGKPFESITASQFYKVNVTDKFFESIQGQLGALSQEFVALKQRSNPGYEVNWDVGSKCRDEFEKWVLNKAAVKERIRKFVHNMLTSNESKRAAKVEELKEKLKAIWQKDSALNKLIGDMWLEKQEAIGSAYDFQ